MHANNGDLGFSKYADFIFCCEIISKELINVYRTKNK